MCVVTGSVITRSTLHANPPIVIAYLFLHAECAEVLLSSSYFLIWYAKTHGINMSYFRDLATLL